jgi:hypothetical protein
MKKIIIIPALLFMGSALFAQTEEWRKILYVTAEDGLRIRSIPSIDGERLGALVFGERIVTYSRTNNTTIDGITAYWYSIDYDNDEWVFGGYLSEEFPEKAPVLLGNWDDIDDEVQYYLFLPDHTYAEGYKETDMGVWGTWSLEGTIITIHLTGAGNIYELDETHDIRLKIIDKNNIVLRFPGNKTVTLRRSRDLW